MTAPGPEAPISSDPPLAPRRRWLTDWKIWLALGVTGVAVYWTLHDIEPRELGAAIASVNPWLVAAMLPVQILALWVRTARWRYLTRTISADPLPYGPLFRATAAGFMAVNILPLRIGEFARPWLLGRETGVRTSAAFGTVVIERAIDFTTVAIIGALVLFLHTQALPTWVRTGATVLAGLGLIPFALTLAVRLDEDRALRVASRGLRVLPEAAAERVLDVLAQLARGLGALRGTHDVLMVALYSLLLWGVVIAFPFALGLPAFGIELGASQAILAVYTALVFTALAVAVPAAPGFFGVYHFACREALALFGVSPAVAVGYGTVLHLAYWVPVTLTGLVVLMSSGLHIGDLLARSPGKARPELHR